MDWKPLLDPAVPYRGALRTAGQVEERVATARARFRGFLDALARLDRAAAGTPPEPAPSFGAILAAAFGPGDVATAWRRWRARADEGPGELERLERGVEESQRQVSQVAAWLDALAREEAGIHAEMEALRRDVADAAADNALAARRAEDLRRALDAVAIAQARALPAEGAALDADAAVLEGLLAARAADARRFESAATRLSAVLAFGTEALAWCARLRASLERVHADGTDVLHELDLHLGRLAAEARAADLGASLSAGMDALRASVGRVHVQAREGVDLLIHRLDALAEAPDLLAPADPARAAAEAEIEALLAGAPRA